MKHKKKEHGSSILELLIAMLLISEMILLINHLPKTKNRIFNEELRFKKWLELETFENTNNSSCEIYDKDFGERKIFDCYK